MLVPLERLTKLTYSPVGQADQEKRMRTQITKTRNENWIITTDLTFVKRIIKNMKTYMPRNLTTFLKWMNSLKNKLTKTDKDETENLNTPISIRNLKNRLKVNGSR